MAKLMAIDASTKSSGIAIFDDDKLVHYECIVSASSDCYKRIKIMWSRIKELYDQYSITNVVMEDVLPDDIHGNLNVFNALHYLQAWIVLNFHDYKQSVELVNVNTWRKTCGIQTGRYGVRESAKAQDIAFVKKNFNIDANDDICDAICIGWAKIHGFCAESPKTPKSSSSSFGAGPSAF